MNAKIGDTLIVKEICYADSLNSHSQWDKILLIPGDEGILTGTDTVVFKKKSCAIRLNWNLLREVSPLEKML